METTTIQTLHAAYVRADEAYNVHDDTCLHEIEPSEELTRRAAMTALSDQSDALRLVILREMPQSLDDLLIVAWHAEGAADLLSACANGTGRANLDDDANALNIMTENLIAFLVRQAGAQVDLESWFGRQLQCALRRVEARNPLIKEGSAA